MSDYRAVPALLDIPVAKPKALLADKGYDGDAVRDEIAAEMWLSRVPSPWESAGQQWQETIRQFAEDT